MGFVLPWWLPELVDQTQTVSSEEAKAMTRRLAREERIENLARLPGGEPRSIPAYNSCGLGMIGSERAGAEALRLLAPDFRAVKVRLGYPDVKTDVDVVRAVKRAVGDNIELMSDYNQSLTVAEAFKRTEALAGEGLYWVEEPTFADDFAGHAQSRTQTFFSSTCLGKTGAGGVAGSKIASGWWPENFQTIAAAAAQSISSGASGPISVSKSLSPRLASGSVRESFSCEP